MPRPCWSAALRRGRLGDPRAPAVRLMQALLRVLPDGDGDAKEEDGASLNDDIAAFYDESSELWEDIWSEHMHHGYYGESTSEMRSAYSMDEHRAAQVVMIDKALEWAGADASGAPRADEEDGDEGGERRLLDVGCGIGGSSRHIVKAFRRDGRNWGGIGVTLSPAQAARANALTAAAFAESPPPMQYLVRDAVDLHDVATGSVDLVWSMESAEHIGDKRKFMQEMSRVCRPGGRIIMVTWCHRSTAEAPLSEGEHELLASLRSAYHLPEWCSIEDYVDVCKCSGGSEGDLFENIRTGDWSARVSPFWKGVIQSAVTPRGLMSLLGKTGLKTIRGALVMPLMVRENYYLA